MGSINELFDRAEEARKLSVELLNQAKVEKFIKDSQARHGDKYDYSLVKIWSRHTNRKVTIVCKEHGPFEVNNRNHYILGVGCPVCSDKKYGRVVLRDDVARSTENYVSTCKRVHKNKYDYDKTDLTGKTTRDLITVTCRKHGDFTAPIYSHRRGNGNCPECIKEGQKARALQRHTEKMFKPAGVNAANRLKKFVSRSKVIHGRNYDYSLLTPEDFKKGTGKYDNRFYVKIKCFFHHDYPPFKVSTRSHLEKGRGCPHCAKIVEEGKAKTARKLKAK